jgi:hypothetical protein
MVVEHRFRRSRGQRTPADAAFYQRVCPVGRPETPGGTGTSDPG